MKMLKCQLSSHEGRMRLEHPRRGYIEVDVSQGILLVKHDLAIELIDKIEESKREVEKRDQSEEECDIQKLWIKALTGSCGSKEAERD